MVHKYPSCYLRVHRLNACIPFRHNFANTGLFNPSSAVSSAGFLVILKYECLGTPRLTVFTTALGSSERPMHEDR